MRKIGVLALQGSIVEHFAALRRIPNVQPVAVKTADAIASVERLILPGGESTTMTKLLNEFKLMAPLRRRILDGMPVWGTCAGMILLAKHLIGGVPALAVMDITVRRNAYGSQLDSFATNLKVPAVSAKPIPAVFIRAPWVESVKKNVEVLAETRGNIVAVRQEKMLATSFHPELTQDLSFFKYFLSL